MSQSQQAPWARELRAETRALTLTTRAHYTTSGCCSLDDTTTLHYSLPTPDSADGWLALPKSAREKETENN
ncbi:hypothetical protein LSTR_LSTR000561 [Laodelphax striatellus]|uniref:Uncharacterized protein n=1 Tax=Laodelphax striatellus TaxID=195883 RepID=A0A482XBT9_LAOST|nr:hypothetical protein LSTR_LSTR000561 [Laodelphax striatellus]